MIIPCTLHTSLTPLYCPNSQIKMPNWTFIGSLLLPNIGGWAGAATMAGQVRRPDNKAWYQTIKKPKWNPPDWVFGPAWTVLYTGMGYASYIIYEECGGFTGIFIYSVLDYLVNM